MVLNKEKKETLIKEYKVHDKDTGSPSVQISLLTERIKILTDHFQSHSKDFQSRRGLLRLVSQRRRLLDYLKRRSPKDYEDIVKKLKIRK